MGRPAADDGSHERQAPEPGPDDPGPFDELRQRALDATAHRLRTPLALLSVSMELLEAADDLPDPVRRHVDVAADNARLVREEMEQLLEVATWSPVRTFREVDVASLVRRVVAGAAKDARERGVTVEVEDGEAAFHQTDPEVLYWALRVLVGEAVAEAGNGGEVRLDTGSAADPDDPSITLSMRMARDRADVDPELESPLGGRTIATELLAFAGARIQDEEATTEGYAVRIALSVTRQGAGGATAGEADSRKPPVRAAPDRGRRTPIGPPEAPLVLVVEDDDRMRAFLLRNLSADYRVIAVPTAEEGAAAAHQLQPDLIVCDIVLPGASGERLVDALHRSEDLSEIPVLVLTGRSDEDLRVRLLRNGADDYVVKPFALGELRARIANLTTSHLTVEDLRTKTERAQTLASQLQHALDSRVIIEQAKAFIAADRNIGVDEAFEVLRGYSRSNNRKLREVAHEVVEQGFRP